MRRIKGFRLLLIFALVCVPGQAQQPSSEPKTEASLTGSVQELRDMRHVLLMVRRSVVVDSGGPAKTILNEAYRPDSAARGNRYPRLFNLLAKKLNAYMLKYQSISAAAGVSDADFIIFFNLLEYRRPLGVPYPYGELFVILNDRSGTKPPRIVWKTRSPLWAEDAIGNFIKDLKAVRGEG
jgi:hypothetical protein